MLDRGYPENLIQTTLSQVNFEDRKLALQPTKKENKRILPFVTQYQPSVPNLKQILIEHWHLIEQQPLLREIYKDLPLISYKRGRSLNDILVHAKLWKRLKHALGSRAGLSTPFYTNEKNVFRQFQKKKFSDVSCTHGRTCVYGHYAPAFVWCNSTGVNDILLLTNQSVMHIIYTYQKQWDSVIIEGAIVPPLWLGTLWTFHAV